MGKKADLIVAAALLAIHAGLLLWALVGFAELLAAQVPWQPLSNPLFSSAMLLAQWSAVAIAAAVFLLGWYRRWRILPWAMAACYAVMAAICAVQTFTILRHDTRFIDMALEYAAYLVIIAWLFSSPLVRRRLSAEAQPMPAPEVSNS